MAIDTPVDDQQDRLTVQVSDTDRRFGVGSRKPRSSQSPSETDLTSELADLRRRLAAQTQELDGERLQRMNAERALLERENLYRTVVDSLADAVAISVGDQRMFANAAFLRLVGV